MLCLNTGLTIKFVGLPNKIYEVGITKSKLTQLILGYPLCVGKLKARGLGELFKSIKLFSIKLTKGTIIKK